MNWLRALFGHDAESPPTEAVERSEASLFQCSTCETVYISEEMQSCPECGAGVDHVPDERDLGIDGSS
jgi:Zn finger protein HypA/HybF involved in hydrogenase expression